MSTSDPARLPVRMSLVFIASLSPGCPNGTGKFELRPIYVSVGIKIGRCWHLSRDDQLDPVCQVLARLRQGSWASKACEQVRAMIQNKSTKAVTVAPKMPASAWSLRSLASFLVCTVQNTLVKLGCEPRDSRIFQVAF
ncbi:hypothetical protein HBI65_213790 [Parastagonospora nodorum]|nr:hypothetical protein HBI65_213790 [Parastagonospora nodorum]